MLSNKKLLIDADCPMCRIYGNGFVKFGLIEANAIAPYQKVAGEWVGKIDLERAKSEIAFHDLQSATTLYGIDAFISILSQNRPLLGKLMRFVPVFFILHKFYRFISFNRKVIAPASETGYSVDCTPAYHAAYRWLYILLSAVFTGWVLSKIASPIAAYFGTGTSPYFEYAMCFGQILWQGLYVMVFHKVRSMDYLGNMSTVSLLGGLLLLPALLIFSMLGLSPVYLMISFALVVALMIKEHLGRSKTLGLPIGATLSWVAYRMVILILYILLFY